MSILQCGPTGSKKYREPRVKMDSEHKQLGLQARLKCLLQAQPLEVFRRETDAQSLSPELPVGSRSFFPIIKWRLLGWSRHSCYSHRAQYYLQPYTPPPPNKEQTMLKQGLSGACVGLSLGGRVYGRG